MLAVLFLAVPAVELWVLLKVGSLIGVWPTLLIVAVTAVAGAALARRQGLSAIQQVQNALHEGRQIGRSMVEAALVLVAGVLLMTPGLITDAVGLALLLPPVRTVVGRLILARLGDRMSGSVVIGGMGGPDGGPASSSPWDGRKPPADKDIIDV